MDFCKIPHIAPLFSSLNPSPQPLMSHMQTCFVSLSLFIYSYTHMLVIRGGWGAALESNAGIGEPEGRCLIGNKCRAAEMIPIFEFLLFSLKSHSSQQLMVPHPPGMDERCKGNEKERERW